MNTTQPEKKINVSHQDLNRKLEEKERQRQRTIAVNKQASAPVLSDLAQAGFEIEWISDLYVKRYNYKNSIPILLRWLPQIENVDVKESIVRALSVPWAKPAAASVLVEEFRKLQNESNTGIKWTIANALSVVADDSVFADIVNLLQDPRHGAAREMLAISLGNMKDASAQDILINLLNDDEIAGHAIMSLGKLKSKKAHSAIRRFANSPKAWVRKEAKKALSRIEKSSSQ